jgi:hypothetical protein
VLLGWGGVAGVLRGGEGEGGGGSVAGCDKVAPLLAGPPGDVYSFVVVVLLTSLSQ